MLNVKTLTDTMSRMELPQLQQYAALHKNDPYIVTLALSIANQKKQMKAGQEGQAGMQPQPKVVDQDIAQMVAPPPQQMAMAPQQQALPEDQGIGTLPAQNMQNFAGGGIVAFGGGGDVPGYAEGVYTGKRVPPGAQIFNNVYKDPVTGEIKMLPEQDALPFGNVPINYAENKRLYEAKKQEDLANRKTAAQNILNESPEDYASRKISELETKGGQQLSPDARNMAMSQFVREKIAGQVKRGEAGFSKSSDLATPSNIYQPKDKAAGETPAGGYEDSFSAGINKLLKDSQTGGAGLPSIAATPDLNPKRYDVTAPQLANATPQDMADRLAAAMGPNPTASPLAGQQEAVNKANVASRQKYADDLAEHFKNQGEAFKGTLEKLTAKEARVKTMEDNQLGMSMFEAGLAMLSGESPHAMVNIGKGAQVGTKKYMEIQDKVEGARDKIDDAKMKIEEFRRNEANMNAREQRLARKDVDDAVSNGAQASLNLMREQYGLKHSEGLAFVNNSYMLDKFNAETKLSTAIHNQATAKDIDLTKARLTSEANIARANMANQANIAARSNATHLGLAALQAKMPPAEARTAMMLGTGSTEAERLESGLKRMQEITSDKTGMAAVKLLTETNAKRETALLPPLTMDELLKSAREYQTLMYPKVVTTPGAKAPVYGRPQ